MYVFNDTLRGEKRFYTISEAEEYSRDVGFVFASMVKNEEDYWDSPTGNTYSIVD